MRKAKITPYDCKEIRERSDNGETYKSISEDYELDEGSIGYHARGDCSHGLDNEENNNEDEKEEDSIEIDKHEASLKELAEESDYFNVDNDNEEESEGINSYNLFDVIASKRRRLTILTIDEMERKTTVSELADKLTSIEFDEVDSDKRKRVYVALYQTHLDKMDSAGVVEYDSDRNTVDPNDIIYEVAAYIRQGLGISRDKIVSEKDQILDDIEEEVKESTNDSTLSRQLVNVADALNNKDFDEAARQLYIASNVVDKE